METLVPFAGAIASAAITTTTATTSATTSATYGCSGNLYWVRDIHGKITFYPPTNTLLNRKVSKLVDGYSSSEDDAYPSSDGDDLFR